MIHSASDHGYAPARPPCIACGLSDFPSCDGHGHRLSRAAKRFYHDCQVWGEIGPDAEDIAGCHGAAFQAVVSSLIRSGYLNDDGSIIQ